MSILPFEQTTCIVCGASLFRPIFSDTLLKCKQCGFVTANMKIDEQLLKEIYTQNYFKGEEYSDYVESRASLQDNFRARIATIRKKRWVTSPVNALEVGCAYGFFAEEFLRAYPVGTVQYTGLDVVPEAIGYAREHFRGAFHLESYLEFPPPAEPYSDIFMWDVVEHLRDARSFLEKAAGELRKGGHIYITTGDIERLVPRMQGSKWRMIHPPTHIHYFSKRTLSELLNRVGMDVIFVSYPPVRRSVRLIFYSLFMLNKKPGKIMRKLYEWIPEKLSIKLNTFDILFLVAKKR